MPVQHPQQRVPLLVAQRVSQEDDPSPLQALSPSVKPSVKPVRQNEDNEDFENMGACIGGEEGYHI